MSLRGFFSFVVVCCFCQQFLFTYKEFSLMNWENNIHSLKGYQQGSLLGMEIYVVEHVSLSLFIEVTSRWMLKLVI